jgi:hypothetical protein
MDEVVDDEVILVTGKLDTYALDTIIREIYATSAIPAPGSGGSDGSGGPNGGPPTGPQPLQYLHIVLPGTRVQVKISLEDWNELSDGQKYAVIQILKNYENSPALKNAMDYYESKNVVDVEIVVGPTAKHFDGAPYAFADANALMAVSSASRDAQTTKTDLIDGYPIVISINSQHSAFISGDLKQFATAFVHELLHPFVPDSTFDPVRNEWTDHPVLYGANGQPGLHDTVRDDLFGTNINWTANLPTVPAYGNDSAGDPPNDPNGPPVLDEPMGFRFQGLDQFIEASSNATSVEALDALFISGSDRQIYQSDGVHDVSGAEVPAFSMPTGASEWHEYTGLLIL